MSESNFDLTNAMQVFFTECAEKLDEMDTCLLMLEKDPDDSDSINELFRAVHTIKGAAGMFNFAHVEEFTHIVENILDKVRKREYCLDSDLTSLLFECRDCIMELVNVYEEADGVVERDLEESKNSLALKLNKYLDVSHKTDEKEVQHSSVHECAGDGETFTGNDNWHISLRFSEDVFRHGIDPVSLISYLDKIGKIMSVRTVDDKIPPEPMMDAEKCYIGFEVEFNGDVSREDIEDVFEFISDDCSVKIIPPRSSIDEYLKLIDELPESSMKLGELLVSIGSLTNSELDDALRKQKKDTAENGSYSQKPIGDIIVEEKMVSKEVLEAALEKQQNLKKYDPAKKHLIKINTDKIDKLINLVGELVITGSNVKQLSERNEDGVLFDSILTMTRLIEDIRDSAMNMRMVPIGETFRKFERTIRDLSRERGKDIELVINGGDTELDKILIDKISDPLMHLIRNAVDHGIDTPEERTMKGKDPKGTISLDAYYETGNIVVMIEDDGNGLDREKIRGKAIALGMIHEDTVVSDSELFQFIFEPGFSTAEKITNISGRGVGMDVVKRNIESLRGTIMLESISGEGTSVKINLPLTLAIIDGFLVQVADNYYVIPLDMVIECTEVKKDDVENKEGCDFMDLRGQLLPFMRLRDYFYETGEPPEKENVIVVEYADKMAGLVVDKPVGELQTVIKPLGKVFEDMKWISGGTILGSGDVALILDIQKLIQTVETMTYSVEQAEVTAKK